MIEADIVQLIKSIDDFASAVNFKPALIEKFGNAPDLSSSCRLWTSPYAEMLAVWSDLSEADIRKNVQIGRDWLDAQCIRRERETGNVVDAYLIVVLDEEPHRSLHEIVRATELDPVACRKHFVWPSKSEDDGFRWSRIFKITSIGLPPSPASSGMTNTPKLQDPVQIELLDDIKDLKPTNAARKHAEQLRAVSKP
ncbi:hypothetical protein [Bradyrhizobium archetypum]|uniref:Uncharacterized protein n=1 Tax=Bradyrhizobium archetypum TaxID=2721160 RepID=A0A7Y4GZN5_9BRAD|nr:hypothetical protein [Bradyrhizobium archetypum]NOJ44723.1 hypothetical protein [Bradyrhizobium archetypum]